MKNIVLILIILCNICGSIVNAQRRYIDLTGCESNINSDYKPDWSLEFQDEFDVMSTQVLTGLQGCGLTEDETKVIHSEHDWLWKWGDAYGKVNQPFYRQLSDNNTGNTGFIRLETTHYDVGLSILHDLLHHPVTRFYSAGQISTQELKHPWTGVSVKEANEFIYGWFEIRCKLPQAKYVWPAFWLFGGSGGAAGYNEIDCFELGSNDYMVHTNWWNNNSTGFGEPTYALPGQNFGGQWITYAVKWEPNKIVWYINNKPVRVVKNTDTYLNPNDDNNISNVIIPNSAMFLIAGTGLNHEWMRYNMTDEVLYPSYMDIDYIRVWQRFDNDPAAYEATPDPVFSINGEKCGDDEYNTIKEFYAGSTKLILDASESYMPDHIYNIIVKQGNTEICNVFVQDYNQINNTGTDISKLNLKMLCNLMPDITYNIILRGSYNGIVREQSQLIKLITEVSPAPNFSINGIINTSYTNWPPVDFSYNKGKSALIMDVTEAFLEYDCSTVRIKYFDGIVGNGNYPYIDIPITNRYIDLEKELKDNSFYFDDYDLTGGYYFAYLPGFNSLTMLFGINSCNADFDFTLNTLNSGVLKIHQIGSKSDHFEVAAGDDIILSATNCTICNNNYTVTVTNSQDLSASESFDFIVTSETDVWNDYGNYNDSYISPLSGEKESYSIGYFDIRKFCRQKGLKLIPGEENQVTLESGSFSESKTFIINESTSGYPSNFMIYYPQYWCSGNSYISDDFLVFLSDMGLHMYSPDPQVTLPSPYISPYSPVSISVDRSYTVEVEDMFTNEPVNKFELSSNNINYLKVLGAFSLSTKAKENNSGNDVTILPVENGLIVPGTYRITLYNYTTRTQDMGFETPYLNSETKTVLILPTDRLSYTGEILIETDKTIDVTEKIYLSSTLRVTSGNTLTILGELHFNLNCKLIVEQGAKLIIDGGKVLNNDLDYSIIPNCSRNNSFSQFWQGIEVWGNSSASQTPNSNQGVVEIINGGTIENATTGIRLCEADENGIVVPGTAGGIVFAENATFINNKVAIQFEPYMNFYPDMYHPRANISRIKDCTFKTTDQWIDNNQKPIAFLVLNGVDGINILGNTFINEIPELFEARRRGMGIKSNNSSFNVNAYCVSNSIPCTLEKKNIFENLYYGIYALKITCTNPVNISNNEFKNNLRGVFLSGINNPVVTRNKFDVGKNESVTDVVTPEGSTRQTIILPGYGLYLQNISHFNVQENEFYSTHNGYCGSLLWKSGIYGKELYNNKYHDLQVGVQTSELNSGLKVKCNKFQQNLSFAGWGLSSGSIANPQGTCLNITSPAGNTFYHSSDDIWVNNTISPFTYKYHNSPETTPVEYDPGNNLTLTTCPLSTYTANACPSKISGKPITQLITDISTLNTTLTDLNTNIDGGSTQALLDKVNSNIRTGQLKNVLMAASPYLSDTVIIATLERSNPLPSGHIKQILIGNSPLTNKVLNAVDKQSLPPGIKNEIQAAQTGGESARAILEQEISNVETDKTFAVTELMQLYAEDTSGTGPANIIAFLETQPDINSKQMLVQAYFSTDRCNDAKTLLDQMPGISSDERDFYTLYSLLAELCTSGNTVYELSSEQKQIVETLALSNSMISANAQAIMSQVYGNWYWEKVEELLDFNSSTIKGMLFNSQDCDGTPVANDTLVIEDENGEILLSITPAITNENGEFIFSMRELLALDSNILYTLKTKSGFALTEQPYQTISEWINQSPLNLSLKNINLEWSDLYDSPDSIWSIGTNIDISGNIYVAGRTRRVNVDDDVVLMKYSPQGVRMWETIYASGINTYENANDMITDAFGNCYISLTSENTNVVLVKFNPDGQLLWSRNIENTIDKRYEAKKVKLTATGNVYIAGHVSTISGGLSDIFIALYSNLGSRQWIKTYSFNDFDLLSDFSLDQNENIIITGYSYNQLEQIKRCLTSKLSSDGALIWSATLNKAHSMGSKISADNNGSVIVAGLSGLSPQELFLSKYSSTGILEWENTIPSYNATDMFVDGEDRIYICGAGNTDIFVSRYNTSGIQDWIKSYNGSANGYDNATAMYPDQNNNVYLTGFTSTSPVPASDKLREMVTLKFDTYGELIWDVVFNTPGHDIISGNDIIVSENDNIYVTGQSGTKAHIFMTTIKYSQCPSQSALRYGVFSEVESADSDIQVDLTPNTIDVYPNPYSGNTCIELRVESNSDVKLTVFTLTGKFVTDVYSGPLNSGTYKYTFSAKEQGYSAGIYILRAIVNNEVKSYRLVEMK